MASYNFYLKNINAPRNTHIVLQITYGSSRPRLSTGISIDPDIWDSKKQRLKGNGVWIEKTNRRLKSIENAARDVFIAYQEENNDEFPPPKQLVQLIRKKLDPKGRPKVKKITFLTFFHQVVDQQMKRITHENKGYRESSVPGYVNTMNALSDYAKDRKKKIDFQDINMDFYWDFLDYMQNVKGLSYNSQGLRIKVLRAVIHRAKSAGYEMNVDLSQFKGFSRQADTIALNETELDELAKLKLEGSLDEIRDIFVLNCWTGLRISDWGKVKPENIRDGMLRIKVQKTGKLLVLPLHPTVNYLLEKYNFDLPSYADQHINRELKRIGQILAKESKHKTLENKSEKYSKITSHVARRSFATNFYYRRVPIDTIRAISGHSTEKSLLTYIRVSPEDHARNLEKYFENDVVPFKEAK